MQKHFLLISLPIKIHLLKAIKLKARMARDFWTFLNIQQSEVGGEANFWKRWLPSNFWSNGAFLNQKRQNFFDLQNGRKNSGNKKMHQVTLEKLDLLQCVGRLFLRVC